MNCENDVMFWMNMTIYLGSALIGIVVGYLVVEFGGRR